MGTTKLVKINTDSKYQIDVDLLRIKIQRKHKFKALLVRISLFFTFSYCFDHMNCVCARGVYNEIFSKGRIYRRNASTWEKFGKLIQK